MKKPKFMIGILACIFLWLGIFFISLGLFSMLTISTYEEANILEVPFLIIGLVSLFVRFTLGIINHNLCKTYENLLTQGTKLLGTVENVYLQTQTKYGRTSPYRICYTYSYKGQAYHHKSHLLWEKPSYVKGNAIEIYINEKEQSALNLL